MKTSLLKLVLHHLIKSKVSDSWQSCRMRCNVVSRKVTDFSLLFPPSMQVISSITYEFLTVLSDAAQCSFAGSYRLFPALSTVNACNFLNNVVCNFFPKFFAGGFACSSNAFSCPHYDVQYPQINSNSDQLKLFRRALVLTSVHP
jgi:hypothetical protein